MKNGASSADRRSTADSLPDPSRVHANVFQSTTMVSSKLKLDGEQNS